MADSAAVRARRYRARKGIKARGTGTGWPPEWAANDAAAGRRKFERKHGLNPGICSECGGPMHVGPSSAPPDRRRCRDCQRARPKNPVPPSRPCVVCGRVFQPQPTAPGQESCSRDCAGFRRRREMQPCEACGALFRAHKRHGQEVRCCSRECGFELQRRESTRETWPSCRIAVLTCGECGELFTSHGGRLLCGDVCRRKRASRISSEGIMRRYREDPEFRDRVISRAQNRHARKLGLDEITRPAALVAYLMERDQRRCGICRKPIRAKTGPRRPSVDHIIPLSRGGQHELSNLQPAHYVCNLSKNNGGGGEQLLLVG